MALRAQSLDRALPAIAGFITDRTGIVEADLGEHSLFRDIPDAHFRGTYNDRAETRAVYAGRDHGAPQFPGLICPSPQNHSWQTPALPSPEVGTACTPSGAIWRRGGQRFARRDFSHL